ncbi:unnamed protein product [Cuscuta epithymum]|uniref:Uncharacterized protein n=1 Tax=Cuscuta epithymum TaxID=186058 RepID=A0AAV0DF80_9ASTE|nr:unnamed protein product [Cuscuta epithymum]CAH9124226.1 unnamed protein product [Cuscuta epithymum]
MVITAPISGQEEDRAESLFCSDGRSWDLDILNDSFEERDVQLIQGMPISLRSMPDRLCWRWESSRLFSVRSCSRALIGEFVGGEWVGGGRLLRSGHLLRSCSGSLRQERRTFYAE